MSDYFAKCTTEGLDLSSVHFCCFVTETFIVP